MTEEVKLSPPELRLPESFEVMPLGDRVIVKPAEAREKTKGGIYLPEDARRRPQFGKVVRVGEQVKSTNIREGQLVFFPQYVGLEVKLPDPETGEEEVFLLMEEKNILGYLREK